METKYEIISDGSCDLSPEVVKANNLNIVPFYVSMDSETYRKEMVEIGVRQFYQEMVDHKDVFPKTSMPAVEDYVQAFTPFAQKKRPVICICITTKFSGSMQSAMNAKNILMETYPDAVIEIIDAQVNTVLQGLYVLEACRIRDMGMDLEESVRRLKSIRESGRIFFTVGSIDYLRHGGRIGKLAGIAGGLIGIKPLITLKDGEIFPSGIVRSRKKSMRKVIDMLQAYIAERHVTADEYSLCIGYGYDKEEAKEFAAMALEEIKQFGYKEIPLFQIGATIGVHTGPYPLGFSIIKRADKTE